jgi:predicted nucleotidyltransferase
MKSILKSFELKDTLNPNIWDGVDSNDVKEIKLKPEVRSGLLKIAKDFIDFIGIDSIVIEDIIFVGSLANFNWSNYSDIDVHVIIDKSLIEGSEELIGEFFDAKKVIYNDKNEITVKGYDVELYAQDIDEELEASGGVYSVLFTKWLKTPTKTEVSYNKDKIIKKVQFFKKILDNIKEMDDTKEKITKIDALREKIRKYRKSGLKKSGEYSDENLIFKYMRRIGFIEELKNLKQKTNDSLLSVEGFEF